MGGVVGLEGHNEFGSRDSGLRLPYGICDLMI
jgi:hypothetical protein